MNFNAKIIYIIFISQIVAPRVKVTRKLLNKDKMSPYDKSSSYNIDISIESNQDEDILLLSEDYDKYFSSELASSNCNANDLNQVKSNNRKIFLKTIRSLEVKWNNWGKKVKNAIIIIEEIRDILIDMHISKETKTEIKRVLSIIKIYLEIIDMDFYKKNKLNLKLLKHDLVESQFQIDLISKISDCLYESLIFDFIRRYVTSDILHQEYGKKEFQILLEDFQDLILNLTNYDQVKNLKLETLKLIENCANDDMIISK